jgi:hypothetical protein
MALKNYSIRLDEAEFEKLRKALSDYGDPDLNVGFVLRTYIRDLNKALPHLKKSELGIRSNLAFWGSALRNINLIAKIENIMKGEPIVERIKKEAKESGG